MPEVAKVLQYIKNNPMCRSTNDNFSIVHELHEQGCVKGAYHPAYSNPSFLDLTITEKGKSHLAEISKSPIRKIFDADFSKKIILLVLAAILAIASKSIYESYKADPESTTQDKKPMHEIQTQATNIPNQSSLPPKKPNKSLKQDNEVPPL